MSAVTPHPEPDTTVAVIAEHIVRTPGTCGGKPRIARTRIKVEQVVIWHERMEMPPSRIVEKWPHLSLADIYASLAFYHDHRDEIDVDLATGEAFVDELEAKQSSIRDVDFHRGRESR